MLKTPSRLFKTLSFALAVFLPSFNAHSAVQINAPLLVSFDSTADYNQSGTKPDNWKFAVYARDGNTVDCNAPYVCDNDYPTPPASVGGRGEFKIQTRTQASNNGFIPKSTDKKAIYISEPNQSNTNNDVSLEVDDRILVATSTEFVIKKPSVINVKYFFGSDTFKAGLTYRCNDNDFFRLEYKVNNQKWKPWVVYANNKGNHASNNAAQHRIPQNKIPAGQGICDKAIKTGWTSAPPLSMQPVSGQPTKLKFRLAIHGSGRAGSVTTGGIDDLVIETDTDGDGVGDFRECSVNSSTLSLTKNTPTPSSSDSMTGPGISAKGLKGHPYSYPLKASVSAGDITGSSPATFTATYKRGTYTIANSGNSRDPETVTDAFLNAQGQDDANACKIRFTTESFNGGMKLQNNDGSETYLAFNYDNWKDAKAFKPAYFKNQFPNDDDYGIFDSNYRTTSTFYSPGWKPWEDNEGQAELIVDGSGIRLMVATRADSKYKGAKIDALKYMYKTDASGAPVMGQNNTPEPFTVGTHKFVCPNLAGGTRTQQYKLLVSPPKLNTNYQGVIGKHPASTGQIGNTLKKVKLSSILRACPKSGSGSVITDPGNDTDGDGLPNNEEDPSKTDPLNNDSDGDGKSDGDEVYGTPVTDPNCNPSTSSCPTLTNFTTKVDKLKITSAASNTKLIGNGDITNRPQLTYIVELNQTLPSGQSVVVFVNGKEKTATQISSTNNYSVTGSPSGDLKFGNNSVIVKLKVTSSGEFSPVKKSQTVVYAPNKPSGAFNSTGTELTINAEPNTQVVITPPNGSNCPVAQTGGDCIVTTTATGSVTVRTASKIAGEEYKIKSRVTDYTGSQVYSASVTVKAPVLPTVNTLVTKDLKPTITGKASLASGESLKITINGATYNPVVINGSGEWTVNTSSASVSSGTLGTFVDGKSYDVVATVTSSDSPDKVDTTKDEVLIDRTAPTKPTVTSLVTNDQTPTVKGSAEPGVKVSIVVKGQTYTTQAKASGEWSVAVTQTLPEGVYDVVATVSDKAGNSAVDSTTDELKIDTTAPAVAPTVDSKTTNDSTPIVTGKATLAAGEALSVTVNGATYNNVNVSGGTWSVNTGSTTPSSGTLGAFADGNAYEVTAIVTDSAGNSTSDITSNELTFDTSSDKPTLVANANGSVTSTPGTDNVKQTVKYTDESNNAVTVVAEKSGSTWSITSPSPAPSGVTIDGTSGVVTLSPSSVKDSSAVNAIGQDVAGNKANATSVNSNADDTSTPDTPTAATIDKANSTGVEIGLPSDAVVGDKVEVVFTPEGSNTPKKVTLTKDANGWTSSSPNDIPNVTSGNKATLSASKVKDGSEVKAKSIDKSGNAAAEATKTMDKSGPTAATLNIDNQDASGDGNANQTEISGKAEPNSTVKIDTNGDGRPDQTVVADARGDYKAVVTPALSSGMTVNVTVMDASGNESPKTTATVPANVSYLDTDGDGIPDFIEIKLGLSPLTNDSDGDGKPDNVEVGDINNPNDADGDGKIDALESSVEDADNDGVPDEFDAFITNDGLITGISGSGAMNVLLIWPLFVLFMMRRRSKNEK